MYQLEDRDNYNFSGNYSNKCGNKLKVSGKGSVNVKPDIAEVVIGVITENVQLEAAQQENSKITQQVINSIIEIGVLPKNIQTKNYNIRINYDYINGKQVFRGYEVSNNLKVRITDINSVGEIIDTAVRNGANNISGLSFIVSNESKYYYEALSLAILDAQNKARVMANKLNVNINIIPVQIIEEDRGDIAALSVATFKSTSGTTPIEAGENIINANVEVEFSYTEY